MSTQSKYCMKAKNKNDQNPKKTHGQTPSKTFLFI